MRDLVHERLRAGDESLLSKCGDDGVARLVHVQPLEPLAGGGRHPRVLADHADLLQPCARPISKSFGS